MALLESETHPRAPTGLRSDESEDLMAQVQRGDTGAFEELVRLYQARLYRIVSGYHRNREDALEVVQDTFMKVYNSRKTWAHKSSLSAWICRIAVNACIDRYRRQGRVAVTSLDELNASGTPGIPAGGNLRGPMEKLADADRRAVLEAAIRALPSRQREVLLLRFFGGLKLEEIALALKCPLGTVKSNLHKAVAGLKARLWHQREELSYE